MAQAISQQTDAVVDVGDSKRKYLEWLKAQGIRVFRIRDQNWQRYKEALVPATTAPCFVNLKDSDAKTLLRKSSAWFLRYCSEPTKFETKWWYVICDCYDAKRLTSNTRRKIRHGMRECDVRRIDADWLAEWGYGCYSAAHSRYANATPVPEPEFRKMILATRSGPIEIWGVFTNDNLAGYCQCIIEGDSVATSIFKFDPAYFKRYSSYALLTGLINHYVVKREMVISNGNRSIAHETAFQDLLLKLGFRKQYCRLNVVYHPWLKPIIKIAFPLLRMIDRNFPFELHYKIRALLLQEELSKQ